MKLTNSPNYDATAWDKFCKTGKIEYYLQHKNLIGKE